VVCHWRFELGLGLYFDFPESSAAGRIFFASSFSFPGFPETLVDKDQRKLEGRGLAVQCRSGSCILVCLMVELLLDYACLVAGGLLM